MGYKMKKHLLNIFLTISVISFIIGCNETITIIEPDSGITAIKLINSSSNRGELDWTYFDVSTYTLHDIVFSSEYQSFFGYYQFESGPIEFRLYDPDSIYPSATVNYNFDFEHVYTVIAYDEGSVLSQELLVLEDTLAVPDTSKSWVRFINLSTDIDQFNVREETLGTLTSFTSKGVPSDYIELAKGSYLINAMDATNGELLTNSDSLALFGGLSYKIIFSGSAYDTTSTKLNAAIYGE